MQDGTEAGNKVKAFYRLSDLPVVMVVEPITGAALRTWVGAMEANRWEGALLFPLQLSFGL